LLALLGQPCQLRVHGITASRLASSLSALILCLGCNLRLTCIDLAGCRGGIPARPENAQILVSRTKSHIEASRLALTDTSNPAIQSYLLSTLGGETPPPMRDAPEVTASRVGLMKAHKRIVDFIEHGTVPEGLKRID
jgi:hypothetical protein